MVNKISIILPVIEHNAAKKIYMEKMGFSYLYDDSCFYFTPPDSEGDDTAGIQLINAPDVVQEQITSFDKTNNAFCKFEFYLKKNFLSYIDKVHKSGITVLNVWSHHGGYTAVIQDPYANSFYVHCSSFDEENKSIDPTLWDFYIRY